LCKRIIKFSLLSSSFVSISSIFLRRFQTRSQSLKKRLFATCPSVRPTGRISMKFDTKDFEESYVQKQQCWLACDKKYRPVYINTHVIYIVASDILSPHKRSFRLKWYRAVRIAEEV
jgi:hypothetical protein